MSKEHLEQFMKRVAEREELQAKTGTAPSTAARYYNLDALRGFAMLLGIGLHAAIPFIPYSEPGDSGSGLLILFFLLYKFVIYSKMTIHIINIFPNFFTLFLS